MDSVVSLCKAGKLEQAEIPADSWCAIFCYRVTVARDVIFIYHVYSS